MKFRLRIKKERPAANAPLPLVGRMVTVVNASAKMAWALNRRFFVVARQTVCDTDGAEKEGLLLHRHRGITEGAFPALVWPQVEYHGVSCIKWNEGSLQRQAEKERELLGSMAEFVDTFSVKRKRKQKKKQRSN